MKLHLVVARTTGGALVGLAAAALLVGGGGAASAAIVAAVPLATAGSYSVLAGQSVTNTGPTVLNNSLGVSPGASPGNDISGFPPGTVTPPATKQDANGLAAQAQADLTAAYNNAAGRPIDGTTTADLAGLTLQGGVYGTSSNGALSLTGNLTLDGANNASTVFIFQTGSSLITATGSTVSLINGAQECNVFWQVGSSATLGNTSVFIGNVLALTSVTVNSGATVHGRALARNGSVTLNNNTFTSPTCASSLTTSTSSASTTSTIAATTTPSTALVAATTSTGAPVTIAEAAPPVVAAPRTGGSGGQARLTWPLGLGAGLLGGILLLAGRRPARPAPPHGPS